MQGLGTGVQSSGCRVEALDLRGWSSGSRFQVLGVPVQGWWARVGVRKYTRRGRRAMSMPRAQGSRFRAKGLRFRVKGVGSGFRF